MAEVWGRFSDGSKRPLVRVVWADGERKAFLLGETIAANPGCGEVWVERRNPARAVA